jgi:ferritin-like protein
VSSESYHEPYEELSAVAKDMHRAIESLTEELEAIDWYQQRMDATQDQELRAILDHNKGEEAEHAMMTLEWIRRHSPSLDAHARTYLFSQGSITGREEGGEGGGSDAASGSLGIGSLRGSE